MKTSKQRVGVLGAGVLALLCSSVGIAATVTVTPSVANPIPIGAFNVVVSVDALFPATQGVTLGLTYNAARFSVVSIVALAPMTFASTLAGVTPGTTDSIAALNTDTAVGGPFNTFQVNFTVLNNVLNQTSVGAANIVFVDDGADFGWSDPDPLAANPTIQGVQYNQASVFVGTVPAPASLWLLVTALGFVGVKAKRRHS